MEGANEKDRAVLSDLIQKASPAERNGPSFWARLSAELESS